MLTLLVAEERPLGIAAQHVKVELLRLVELLVARDIALAHHIDGGAALSHFQLGLGSAADHANECLTRCLRSVLRHLEAQLL